MAQFHSIAQRIWRTRDAWVTLTLLGISVYCVVLLRGMRQSGATAPSQPTLTVGQKHILTQDLNDKKIVVDWGADKRPALVYIFRESCVWCARNMANISALTKAANRQYRIIGVSLSDVQLLSYTRQNKMIFPIYKNPKLTDGKPFSADGTPETLIVSSSGVITKRWLGAYGGDTQKQIEQMFNVHLPGMSTEAEAEQFTAAEPVPQAPERRIKQR